MVLATCKTDDAWSGVTHCLLGQSPIPGRFTVAPSRIAATAMWNGSAPAARPLERQVIAVRASGRDAGLAPVDLNRPIQSLSFRCLGSAYVIRC